MINCDVLLVLAGVYATYSRWINLEMHIAKNVCFPMKPIIAIEPWGSSRTSLNVKASANKVVGWNSSSVISAIREIA